MNAKNIKLTIGSGLGAAVLLGMLVAMPAQASNAACKITHSDTPYVSKQATTPAPATVAKAQPAAPAIQVAVMAKAPAQPAAKRAVFIHR